MGFFENLGKTIGSATDTAADKAKKLAEISKLKSAVSGEEKLVERLYAEIGKKTYELDRDDPRRRWRSFAKRLAQA